MKKKLLLTIIAVSLIGGFFSFFYFNNAGAQFLNLSSKNQAEEKRVERERIVKENTKKYQPQFTNNTKTEGVEIATRSAIVVDQETNEIIFAKNIEEKMAPASIIKILTLIIAQEKFEKNELIEVSQRASEQVANKISLKAGERLRLSDLLYGLMMISANDAAYAIADFYKGGFNGFISSANEKISILGLKNTKMKNPAGFDENEQKSTVFDMATITRYALINHPEIINYAGKTTEHSVFQTEHNQPHWWFGHLSSMLKNYPYMIAAKTGFTYNAGTTYVGVAEKDGRRLVLVMLGSSGAHANEDVKKLLDFGFAN